MKRSVALVSATSHLKMERAALGVLEAFQPESLIKPQSINVEKFFEGRLPKLANVNTDYKKTSTGIYGWTNSDKMDVVISIDLIETADRATRRKGRATIVHECGHAIYHIPQFKSQRHVLHSIHDDSHANMRLFSQDDIPNFVNAEWQAWRWGRAFIMPMPTFRDLVRKGCDEAEIAEIFDVNPAFVKTRIWDLQHLEKFKL